MHIENITMPYFSPTGTTKQIVKTICNICVDLCPAEAISIDHQSNFKTDVNSCILCFACVKNCPTYAREIDNLYWSKGMEMLQKQCLERKEPYMAIIS